MAISIIGMCLGLDVGPNEVRVFLTLKEEQKRGCHYFAEWDDNLQPVSLILGARCRTTDREIASATSGYSTPIKIVRTVLATDSFQVIPQPSRLGGGLPHSD
jgi:hypothetical protein